MNTAADGALDLHLDDMIAWDRTQDVRTRWVTSNALEMAAPGSVSIEAVTIIVLANLTSGDSAGIPRRIAGALNSFAGSCVEADRGYEPAPTAKLPM
jgi:hypothetical protein